ncbi:hypothetical protein [Dermatobacter hominis]|uniref:hypothetical protein n=1 Tax=Dermatobacter hominis TaxID=2884263 RepID=UPI001D12622A|nr:hypothetical protein [Dermatobacter hominis]UDY34817.1 hypothetical protein LH044_15925 [Dermatobacter hominis]
MQERESDLDLRVGTNGGGRDGLHRIVDPTVLGTSDSLARHRRGLLTGLSIVVVDPEPVASAQVAAATDWAPPEFRVEFVLGDPSPALTDRLDVLAWPWSAIALPTGRLAALDAATAQASGEFVVIGSVGGDAAGPSGDDHPFEQLGEALGLMWVNGADALVLGQARELTVPDEEQQAGDLRPTHLATALGVRRGGPGALVVLRRWVARFLFDDIASAIDPLHEFGDRVRLLELRLLEVLGPG